ncbi:MAG: HEAT repeat domain-containing protein [Elusimicrobiota bacterium]
MGTKISNYIGNTSLVIDRNDQPHISYINEAFNEVRYAKCNVSGEWEKNIIDNGEEIGVYFSIVIDNNLIPHIVYGYYNLAKPVKDIKNQDENIRIEAVKKIIETINSDEKIRNFAMCSEDVHEILISIIINKKEDIHLRNSAAFVLGPVLKHTNDPRLFTPLSQDLKDKDARIRSDTDYLISVLAYILLTTPLIETLDDKDKDVRKMAAFALGELGCHSDKYLIAKLNDPDPEVRGQIAIALGKMKSNRAIKPLIDLLKDTESEPAMSAVRALCTIGDNSAIPYLIEAIGTIPFVWVELSDSNFNREQLTDYLLAGLKNKNPYIHAGCALALGELKDPRAIEPLKKLLKNKNKDIRENAKQTLENIQKLSN